MKYNVKIGEKSYEVIVDDINKRPIVAHVNGQEFMVNPELETSGDEAGIQQHPVGGTENHARPGLHESVLVAPLPGTVIEVFFKPGDEVEAGQVILIIEAMKMKNSIRSTKDGIVAAVLVSAGETVAHKQRLVEFEA